MCFSTLPIINVSLIFVNTFFEKILRTYRIKNRTKVRKKSRFHLQKGSECNRIREKNKRSTWIRVMEEMRQSEEEASEAGMRGHET